MEDRKENIRKRVEVKKVIKSFRDLDVYNISYDLAMEIFHNIKNFPREEVYSLSNQILRSSRSIPANIAEGYSKRKYENVFKRHLNVALGSCDETNVWLDFALDCRYITKEKHNDLANKYKQVGAMIYSLMNTWRTF
ncbi:MAG: four helix bundle protein [Thermoplasmata archaeon]|nr:four helix bundle protein [Thermoplasmata archaeon]